VRARVAILSGDAVVSRALEVLLQGLGYHTRLIEEFGAGQPDELLGGIAERANMEAIELGSYKRNIRRRIHENMRHLAHARLLLPSPYFWC
jgi:hypothetical protein